MSLYDDASLIVTPNAYKTSKLYSIKPTDGSGDLSVVRATTATRVNSDGLIELVPYNLLNYSEQFDNAFWVKSGTTIIANDTISPDGNTTADRVTRGASGNGTIEKSFSTTNSTFSVFAKKGNSNLISLFILGSSHIADFNLDLGTITSSSGTGVSPKIENYGNGWFRCILENVPSVTQVRIYAGGVGTAVENDYNYIWGAQLVQGSEAKEYLRTETGLNIPRLDYSNGCPSILVEPQRTNLLLRSEEFENASWSKTNVTVAANQTTAPDGNLIADLLAGISTGGSYLYQNVTVVSGQTYTISIFAKKNQTNFLQIFGSSAFGANTWANFDLENGTVGSKDPSTIATITSYSNEWYKCTISNTTVSTIGGCFFVPVNSATAPRNPSFDATNHSIYIWGAQLEAGANATSYIPTVASAVTRNSDVISKTGISDLIGQTEGTMFVDFSTKELNTLKVIFGTRSINNQNNISISTDSNNNIRLTTIANNSTIYNSSANIGLASNTFFKIAVKYTTTNIKLFVNGVLILNSGVISLNFSTLLDYIILGISINNLATLNINGNIKSSIIFKTALTDQECISLTTL